MLTPAPSKPKKMKAGLLVAILAVSVGAFCFSSSARAEGLPASVTASYIAGENIKNVPLRAPKVPEPELAAMPSAPPPLLNELQKQKGDEGFEPESSGLEIRNDALREAALSYGARGGLAYRTFEIQRRLAEYDKSLTKIFHFARLLIPTASGLLIEPPVVSSADRAVIVKGGGQTAATADRVLRISRGAQIVTAPRDWHIYLERDWGNVAPPPKLLLPKTDDEVRDWKRFVAQGWDAGVNQAEETFEADLARMVEDFVGMVRYRELLAQGMISAPYALADNRGVTGNGMEMRIGDRGVTITGPSTLISKSSKWKVAPQ